MSHFAFVESHKGLADRQYHQLERKHLSIPATLPASTHFMPNREIIHAVLSAEKKRLIISMFCSGAGHQYLFIYLFHTSGAGYRIQERSNCKITFALQSYSFLACQTHLLYKGLSLLPLLCYSAEELPKEGGVFVTLQNRYYSEYAALLEYVHKSDKTEPMILLALLKSEAFIVDRLGDFKISSLYVGLMERLNSVLQMRYEYKGGDDTSIKSLCQSPCSLIVSQCIV